MISAKSSLRMLEFQPVRSVGSIIDALLVVEGGYVNDPADTGGETNFGITIAVARANGYTGPMRSMPESEARRIYKHVYWIAPGFVWIEPFSEDVAIELFDTGVNMGVGTASRFLQEALNAFNNEGKLYPDMKEDGDIGPTTMACLERYADHRGAQGFDVLLKALNCLQGAKYLQLSKSRAKNERFVYGWIDHRISL